MPYTSTLWTNREVERPRTYTLQANGDGTTTLIPAEGNILSAGTPITAENMNNIEEYLVELSQYSEIVEKGQNANGHYIRWSHGYQLCWGMVNNTVSTGPNGSLHSATLSAKSLPATFSHTTYAVSITPYFTSAVGTGAYELTGSSFRPRLFTISALTNQAVDFGFIAFGRWYES